VYLEEARQRRLGDIGCQKLKCVADQIGDLKAKRLRLEGEVTELLKCADEFSISAEQNRDFSSVTKSNAMRQSARQKGEELLVELLVELVELLVELVELLVVQKELDDRLATLKAV